MVQKQLLDAMATQPGVRSVAGTDDPMLAGDNYESNITFANRENKPDDSIQVEWSAITPELLHDHEYSAGGRQGYSPMKT